MKFHHVGLAVKNINKYYENYLKPFFGFDKISEIQAIEAQKVRIAFVENSDGVKLELIEPINEESPVIQVLKRKRGGLYHLGFTTSNFEEDIKRLKKAKFLLLSKKGKLAFLMAPTFEVYELIGLS